MTTPRWFKPEVTIGNVVAWVLAMIGAIAAYVSMQIEVRALVRDRDETKIEIRALKDQRAVDREQVIEMRGDIRVIRQILEDRRTK